MGEQPFVGQVGDRFAVYNRSGFPPETLSGKMMVKFGVIADFADRDTAEKFADRVRKQRWDLYKKNGLHGNISA